MVVGRVVGKVGVVGKPKQQQNGGWGWVRVGVGKAGGGMAQRYKVTGMAGIMHRQA